LAARGRLSAPRRSLAIDRSPLPVPRGPL